MSDINHGWDDKEPKEIILHPRMYEKYREYPEKEKDIMYEYPRRERGCLKGWVIIFLSVAFITSLFIWWFS